MGVFQAEGTVQANALCREGTCMSECLQEGLCSWGAESKWCFQPTRLRGRAGAGG